MAYTVFISYEKSDKDVADKVCSAIESRTIGSRKIQCWIAPRDVPIGIPYRKAIVQAIREVQLMVLVLSSAANDSLHVINEVEEAHSKGITIVPLVVEDVTLDDRLEFCIAGINWLDATDKPLEACLEQLGDSIERLVSRLKPKPERESEEEPETLPKPVPPKPKPPKEGEMLLSNVKAFFKEYDWKFKEVPEETTLRTGFKGKSGSWNCIARTHEDKDIFLFYSILEYNVPEDRRAAAAEYLTRANYGLRLGNFEMDFEDGEVRYKTSIDVEGGTLTVAMVRNMILANVFTVEKYLARLNKVVFGKAVPAEAIKEAEEKTEK